VIIDFQYKDPYFPSKKLDNLVVALEKSYGNQLFVEYDQPDEIDIEQPRLSAISLALAQAAAEEELEQKNLLNSYYIDDDEGEVEFEEPSRKLIAQESIMSNNKRLHIYRF
jgi:hypothetical protein